MRKHQNVGRNISSTRQRLIAVAATMVAIPFANTTSYAQEAPFSGAGIKAITFDVQGTLVDYSAPFARVTAAIDKRKGTKFEWVGFLADWNTRAATNGLAIVSGKRAWVPVGQLLREALDATVAGRGLNARLDNRDRIELLSLWGQMVAWPDSVDGLALLRRRAIVAALSNAGMAATIATTKRTGLTFDAVLSGELVHAYKPSPEVYQAASTYLGVPAGAILMVSAHKIDLKAAKASGFRTAYIARPGELGPDTKADKTQEPFVDIYADSLTDLARKLDADTVRSAN
ncbi:haloacid dehalogenase type II [Sphingomonas glacialis]|nr:haloacid dehalogenase type II [Sphingomonas glacialis]